VKARNFSSIFYMAMLALLTMAGGLVLPGYAQHSQLQSAKKPENGMLFAVGDVKVNGTKILGPTAVFAGDKIETSERSTAAITGHGGVVYVNPQSSVVYSNRIAAVSSRVDAVGGAGLASSMSLIHGATHHTHSPRKPCHDHDDDDHHHHARHDRDGDHDHDSAVLMQARFSDDSPSERHETDCDNDDHDDHHHDRDHDHDGDHDHDRDHDHDHDRDHDHDHDHDHSHDQAPLHFQDREHDHVSTRQ